MDFRLSPYFGLCKNNNFAYDSDQITMAGTIRFSNRKRCSPVSLAVSLIGNHRRINSMQKFIAALIGSGLILLLSAVAHAGSATWDLNPGSGDWNNASNWTPITVPNGPADTATFGLSNTTAVSISADTTVDGITFEAGASAFTVTASPGFTLTLSGTGITNNSGT